MQRDSPDYSMLVVNAGGSPGSQTALNPPRRALVTTQTYGGQTVTLEIVVVARSGQWLCVEQRAPGWDVWYAWIPSEQCRQITER